MWSAFVLICSASLASAVLGPIATDAPAPAGGSVANNQPPLSSFFTGHSPPYPTDDWWVGYAAGSGDAVCAGPFPYQSNLAASSIQFGMSSDRSFDGTSIKQPTQTDWSAGFDTQSVQVEYSTGSSSMTGYMVPGSPYMTFNFAGATPLLTSGQGPITSFNGSTVTSGVSATGSKFTVVNNIGTYVIYSLSGDLTLSAQATASASTVQAASAFTGVLRMVKLNSTSHEALLDEYYANYPTGVTTDYSFSGDTADLTFTWDVVGTASDLLMLTWPHHRIKMVSPNFPATTALNYLTTKGYMYPALGNVWTLAYDLSTITFNAPRAPDSSCTAALVQGVQYEIGLLSASSPSVPGDFYYWGGSIAAQGRLALIADHLGQTSLISNVVDYLEASYAYWFESSSSTLPAYETAWGGIINAGGADDVNVDFGNGFYNDHHFHYGYFLTGAAIIAKYDSSWMAAHLDYINYFLRDIVNPSRDDPYFPVTRHRDWFAGHSWASGVANGAGSRDEESTGEGNNAYYGAMLWANVSGNADIYNYARLLLATEQHGTQPYPEDGVRALVTIGNVEDWQSGAWLFWGAEKVEIAAIQMLPVTPVNEYLYDSAWVNNVFNYAQDELTDPTIDDEWKCVIYDAYSQYNPQSAAALSTGLSDWGTGNTYTNTLYFISTRPNTGGSICSATNANPIGNFTISTSDGLYVVSTAANANLIASGTSTTATKFAFAWMPNSGSIFNTVNSQFVTADQSGIDALASARATVSSWETFTIRPKVGAASGVYSIKANANGLYVIVGAGGALINNATTEAGSTGFIIQ
ncbi:glycoside hydrolase family 81 protein [Athelia psychrophila]|uniref:glucan endo-1,3-beta-D-glucosidase n=1 Tax=Athelia psychrophila TaxID=1759441 RepID=A0A166AQ70_9AGAM|nr:glycoside hydrolase family 81 protein [Fibularhizoctonia sp. CBS 109695]